MAASSTAGCCRSYQLLGASSVVVIYQHGRLWLLHYPSGRLFVLLFNTGRGDAYAGIRCLPRHEPLRLGRVTTHGPCHMRYERKVTALDSAFG